MAACASSSQVSCGKHDVFISFRGSDIRSNFLCHLKKALRQKNVDVYVDDRLERGEEIWSVLVNAIEGSIIALVIFSENYASSKWCLEELVKIMECMEANQQIMIPIFYHVDPSNVRYQKRTYADAFIDHEHRSKDNDLQIWRSVLKKTADLSGYHSSNFQDESVLIDAIVEDVLKKLEDNNPIVPKSQLVGFHQNFSSVESLMKIESQGKVRILGIWGMAGIGKTTLAYAIFDKFLSKFESCCFIENVREKSWFKSQKYLSQKLLSKLIDGEDLHINKTMAMRRLQQEKVLIVLDDVNDPKQLKYVAGQQLGLGSTIIATSRDKHVLNSGGIQDKYIHEVKELCLEESLELFSIHAFNRSRPNIEYEELSKRTVAIAKGIPLALEVLGSHFHSRDKACWESELSKLQKYPHQHIQNILRVSYDGLDFMDREIFLDIAFFFVGERKDEITYVLEACDFKAVSGIQNLIDRALIKSYGYGHIVMHDLIREMAEQIVREESMKHPERRSRLKDADDICDVLNSNMGTDEIEGIILNMSQRKKLQLSADVFIKMKNLRILKFFISPIERPNTHIKLPSGLDFFPNKLRCLHWDHYPLNSLPLGSYFENLVQLHMRESNVKSLWDGKQDLANLNILDLTESKQLMELPDFSMARKLETVMLEYCESLSSIHPSILSLHSIVNMSVAGCSKLESLESETHLESLSFLNAYGCYSLKKFSLSSKKLRKIYLNETMVEMLHFPNNHFPNLKSINLRRCKRLKSILGLPPFLVELDASDCTLLETVSSDSLPLYKCNCISFQNCVKLNEHSLHFIEEFTFSSMRSTCDKGYRYFSLISYPRSRVPEWMNYKPMREDSNAIDFTCNLERSHDILFCCVAPGHALSKGIFCVYCECSWDDKKEIFPDYPGSKLVSREMNSNHVFLWYIHGGFSATKISCEFFLQFFDKEKIVFYKVPAKACGIHLLYY